MTDHPNAVHFSVITLFPEMFHSLTAYGVTGRAVDHNIISVSFLNPRDFTNDRHRTVDDRPYGGGPGMVMLYEPLAKSVEAAKASVGPSWHSKVIYLTPQGQPFNQQLANDLADKVSHLILVCGRYEGVDERFIEDYVDLELSIGDFVVSGGELPAMLVMDTLARLLPGTLGSYQSTLEDSFFNGLLDCPHYTRPAILSSGRRVPEILLSGHHRKIEQWRRKQRLGRTYKRRPEVIEYQHLSREDKFLLNAYIAEEDQDLAGN